MSAWVWIGVGFFGGIGALARFLLDGVIGSLAGKDFPFGTLAVNTSGSLLLGLLTGLALSSDALLLAGTATLGAYTTFSTWMLETHRLSEDREISAAAVNVGLSLAVGIGAAAIGRVIEAQL